MRRAVELADVHDVVFVLQYGRFVVINIKVVGSTEDSHDARKPGGARLSVHSVAGILSFMGANDREEIVLLEKGAGGRVGEEIGAAPDVIVDKEFRRLLLAELLQWISPEYIAHEAVSRRLAEAINLLMSVSAPSTRSGKTYALEIF